ncbi:segregation/condensation protein A [Candidatus Falkowbacteria bacterium]|jgi:segregation and condensation protein A|nr:segregation/condensation protein A [Candidatus Falkowbacteria bacterium]MBT7007740.1 segregation/condensation protein A [Candidatus Falkowbacteria bacterium]
MYKVKIEKFAGPMDLLLQLLDKHELEITEIAIAEVTDQFLEHIELIEDRDAEELSDFLVLATRLLYLKSKALLPLVEDEEGELDDLEKQLKMYKQFVDASKIIEEMIGKKRFTFSREKAPMKTVVEFSPPTELRVKTMRSIYLSVLKRLDPLVKLPQQTMEKTVSLQKTIFDLKDLIKKQKKVGFKELMSGAKNRTEVIVNFLAVLELVKQRQLIVRQASLFEDIHMEKV